MLAPGAIEPWEDATCGAPSVNAVGDQGCLVRTSAAVRKRIQKLVHALKRLMEVAVGLDPECVVGVVKDKVESAERVAS